METKNQNDPAIGLDIRALAALPIKELEDRLWIQFRIVLVIGQVSKAVLLPGEESFDVLIAPEPDEAIEAVRLLAAARRALSAGEEVVCE